MLYAEAEVKRLATLVINKSIDKQLSMGMDVDSMFEIVRNNDGEIEMIDFNTVNVTKILSSMTELIESNLMAMVNGEIDSMDIDLSGVSDMDYEKIGSGVIFEATMGSITGSSLINNIGPKVPVKLNLMGDVVCNVETSVKEYGINNALIEVGIKVSVDTMVNTPFVSDVVNVETVIPVSMKVISGSIPSYYFDGFNNSSEY